MSDRWCQRVVLVVGGSAGFGRVLAREFAACGARVVVAARDATRLEDAVADIARQGLQACGIAVDITSEESVHHLLDRIRQQHGRLDVLANMAGRSMRRAVEETSADDFAALLDINFLGMVRTVQAALPDLRRSGGSIVNMGSLASKIATGVLGAYPASKFAVAAYSQQLRLALAPQVHVLLVCPGPIRRDDADTRYEAQTAGLPESARQPGGGARVPAMEPQRLARRIVRACESRTPEIVVPAAARWLCALSQLAPSWGDWWVRRMTR